MSCGGAASRWQATAQEDRAAGTGSGMNGDQMQVHKQSTLISREISDRLAWLAVAGRAD